MEEFRIKILEEARFNAVTNLSTTKEEFIILFINSLLEAEEVYDFNLVSFEGVGSRRKKIMVDGYSYDELDNCYNLFICVFSDRDIMDSFTSADAEKAFSRLTGFIEASLSGFLEKNAEESSPGFGLATDIKQKNKNIKKYKLYILTDMIMSSRIKDIPAGEIKGKKVEFHIWDIFRYQKLADSKTGREEIVIDLTRYAKDGLPCLEAGQTDDYTAYLCNIPGKILAELYNTYSGRLLEGNVRSFLTIRGKINKGIRNTILNEPQMFFAFNNGIAATAFEVKTEQKQNTLYLREITGLQIVNGGQTTVSLAMAMINDREKVSNLASIFVPMKLSVVSPEKSIDLIPKIAKYANKQNKVNEADFFSNHAFHIRMEELSQRVIAPAVDGNQYGTYWYYERAHKQYNQAQARMSKSDKNKFLLQYPKRQMFTKTDLARYYNLYKKYPHYVSEGAQKNFMRFATWVGSEWEKDPLQFNEEFFKSVVSIAIIFRGTDRLVNKQLWYEKGYKAQIVNYSLALLLYTIETKYKGYSLDLKSIWNRQKLNEVEEQQMMKIAESAFFFLIDAERDVQNVTEWAKKERCWEKAKKIEIKLSKEFVDLLIPEEENKQIRYEARQEQKAIDKASAMIQVAKYGADYWEDLYVWGKENRSLDTIQLSALKEASVMNNGRFPTERQCIKILDVLNFARQEGYSK